MDPDPIRSVAADAAAPRSVAADAAARQSLEPTSGPLTFEELQLAGRNRGMPLEALRYATTPTGLHYLLVHWDIPDLDATAWRLRVDGLVRRPLELTLADLRARPEQTLRVTMECAGNGRARLDPRPVSQPWLNEAIGTAEWTGTPLAPILVEAGIADDAAELVFTGADRGIQGGIEQDYGRSLAIADAMRPEVMIATAMNGQPLQPQHGFPARLVVPGWYGMASVKWLTSIRAVAEAFTGYQQTSAYRYQRHADDLGEPVTRIRVRALMVPPGIPDFFTRRRFVEAGQVGLAGRAWSGHAPVERVEVGVDGLWQDATLDPGAEPFAWRGWSFDWDAAPGDHVLACRATDGTGSVQPAMQPWNYQGMGNNLVQEVAVTVR
jgi:DMSO/TMAO reductase YedYZ molybdopterin-dependent catalytic subunit